MHNHGNSKKRGKSHKTSIFLEKVVAMDMNELKKQSAVEAVKQIKSGDVVGLGTGSTAYFAVEEVGRLLKEGILKDIVGVATSIETDTHVRLFISFDIGSRVKHSYG